MDGGKETGSRAARAARVKICGITRPQDALEAAEAGADALGFNFYPPSPRFLAPRQAQAIIRRVPPFVSTVGVFADPSLEEVRRALLTCRLDYLQFSGDEDPEFLAQFPADKVIKAFRLRDRRGLKALARYPLAGSFLLDAWAPGLKGGTGKRLPWDLALEARRRFDRPLILAGGLNPGNVAEAVRRTRPWAVDVASGVESAPGRKDRALVAAFVRGAKGALEAAPARPGERR